MVCPKTFLCAIPFGLAAGLLIFMSLVRLQLGVPTSSSEWIKEIIDRKEKAAGVIVQPKLVLLGGSSTLFGIKASVLESELGVPVINCGLHAGLGMACILREGKKMLRPGDTVMLIPEYELLSFGEKNRREWAAITYLDFMLSRDIDYYSALPIDDQIEIALMTPLDRILSGIRGKWSPEQIMPAFEYNPYDSLWLDDHGDMTGHRVALRPAVSVDRDQRVCEVLVKGISPDAEGFVLISEFKRWAKANRVRVMAGFPNMIHRKEYDSGMADNVESKLKQYFLKEEIHVVGGMREVLLPQVDFFDTIYHPTEEASITRSMKLAFQLRPLIGFVRR
jgi:hypothetical protein